VSEHPLDRVNVWVAALDLEPARVYACAQDLAPDEAARAARFVFERDRRKFTVARSTLRRLLARYLDQPAGAIQFEYGARGKPSVPGVEFNLSHSGEVAVYAFTHLGAVGIDVEWCRPMPDALQIAERFFSAPERDVLRRMAPERREDGFFACWTRKEAYIKVLGDGLFTSLDRFVVTLEGEARLLSDDADPTAQERISTWSFVPSPGYVGAVMVVAPNPTYSVQHVPRTGLQ
jgi:4'-phosphopantetheinyl transferase